MIKKSQKQQINQTMISDPLYQTFLISLDPEVREYARKRLIMEVNRKEEGQTEISEDLIKIALSSDPETFLRNLRPFRKSAYVTPFVENGVVGAYASLLTEDCQRECIPPSSYRTSANEYIRSIGKIFFNHNKTIPAGTILKQFSTSDGKTFHSGVDEVGLFIVSKPYPEFYQMIIRRQLRGYSIAGNETPNERIIKDISYARNPCNKQCAFGD